MIELPALSHFPAFQATQQNFSHFRLFRAVAGESNSRAAFYLAARDWLTFSRHGVAGKKAVVPLEKHKRIAKCNPWAFIFLAYFF
jgi:hypothetical protein